MNLDPIAQSVFDGLLSAYKNHIILGESGKNKDKQNRFGDMALRADVAAEEKILSALKTLSEEKDLRIICRSEELGDQELNPKGKETLFVVFDGLDGSSNYLKDSEFGYGTMVAIAHGENPKYEDFFVAGEAIMKEGKLVLAVKGRGVLVYDVPNSEFKKLDKFNQSEEFDNRKILANKYFPEEIRAYGDKPWIMTGSTAWSIFTVCSGDKYSALIEVTRKKNLEQPTLYLLINELGGVMVDKNGESIGPHGFKSWGQSRDGEEFLVSAKNEVIAMALLASIDSN